MRIVAGETMDEFVNRLKCEINLFKDENCSWEKGYVRGLENALMFYENTRANAKAVESTATNSASKPLCPLCHGDGKCVSCGGDGVEG
jgi:hypothetical protein